MSPNASNAVQAIVRVIPKTITAFGHIDSRAPRVETSNTSSGAASEYGATSEVGM